MYLSFNRINMQDGNSYVDNNVVYYYKVKG